MQRAVECLEYQVKQISCYLNGSERRTSSGLLEKIRRWRELSHQRSQLSRLSDEMLKDIGINRVDALREAKRPFWDDPGRCE